MSKELTSTKSVCPQCYVRAYENAYGCHNCDYNVQNIENEKKDNPRTIEDRLEAIELELVKLRNDLAVTFHDEFSEKRKEMSDRLVSKMQARLDGEKKAREQYNTLPKPGDD